ncbi:MAG TPA: ABC transporter permease [Hymenobacter sp.]|jgi:hypothetical protein|uniref:ABC transporter permease n=1 Tax=Hymenobacter sp. TaxID=1898978 RepID=UPI002ED9613C
MFDLDKWQEILGIMRRNKLRTFLTAFGVFWGLFMLVLLLGAGKGLENGIWKEFGAGAKNSLFVSAGKTSLPWQGLQPGRQLKFTNTWTAWSCWLRATACLASTPSSTAPKRLLPGVWGQRRILPN